MKHTKAVFVAVVLLAACWAPSAHADPANYGFESVDGSLSTTQAGGHPDFTTSLTLNTENFDIPASTRDVTVELPQGLVANPTTVPQCSTAEFVGTDFESKSNATGCPQAAQVGVTHIVFSNSKNGTADYIEPVFNLVPKEGEPARLGFIALSSPVVIDTEVRPDYGVTSAVRGADTQATLYKTELTIWGVPADESHDAERMTPYEAAHNQGAIETPTGTRPSGLVPVPFTLNPTRCGEPLPLRATTDSYQEPERLSEGTATLPAATGCGFLDFDPDLAVEPTTSSAGTGSGLDARLTFPSGGYEHPNLLGEDEQKRVEVTLPEGMTINPSEAEGLGACSEADFQRESASSLPGVGCPESSKIGTVSATTPLLSEAAEGNLYIAKPFENPFNSLIAVYMTVKVPQRGVAVKLAGKVTADPGTGQLTATFGEPPYEIPQLPVSFFNLHFREGARAPLVTPPSCGSYSSSATFTSWGGHTAVTHPGFAISSGLGGGPCPSGPPGFSPSFEAGSISNAAGAYSPFYMRFSRSDADRELTRFSVTLPPGEVAKLAGVTRCPQAAIDAAKQRNGAQELAAPSCPASSQIGHLVAGAGTGSTLTYVPGKLYLAGPYRGSQLSVVAIVPAVAGPFDLGTVVTQETLGLEPESGRAVADGGTAEPLPRILQGVPLRLRDVRIYLDRPGFSLNPTSCEPLAGEAALWAGAPGSFSGPDARATSVSARYQAADCSHLGFKPKLSLRLKGGTKRGDYPALRAVLRPRQGDANIAFSQVALPHSEFLAQEHIRTICTRVQFAAGTCPAGSVYGHARAISPLLDQPLEGPVYLRSSNHPLPDLVADLGGEVHIVLVGRIDSFHQGIRATFAGVPDAPVSKFVLSMQGGKKGLLVNSADICRHRYRGTAVFTGHNGRRSAFKPAPKGSCGGGKG